MQTPLRLGRSVGFLACTRTYTYINVCVSAHMFAWSLAGFLVWHFPSPQRMRIIIILFIFIISLPNDEGVNGNKVNFSFVHFVFSENTAMNACV